MKLRRPSLLRIWNVAAFFVLILAVAAASSRAAAPVIVESDVCVYGATAGGISAAVQTARMKKKVVVAEAGLHWGGLTSGGLGYTDFGNKAAIGGIARDFYQRIGQHYGKPEAWTFEPHAAEFVLRNMLKDYLVSTYFKQRVISVKKEGGRIIEFATDRNHIFRAKMFIDASYEGDLLAKAGISHTVGREPNSQYGETLNGVRAETPKHQFMVPVDPYVKRGDPSSGLLPFIQSGNGGEPGSGDRSVQAYNYRLCLTQNPTNQIPIAPPADYSESRYELLGRYLDALIASGKTPRLGDFMDIKMVTKEKSDVNNNGAFSTDFIGQNYEYPEADYATREKIAKEHENYIRGFLHYLATSARVRETVRAEMKSWGLAKDEFQDTGGWPHQMYVREARRMVSDYVMTEKNCRGEIVAEDSIGLGAYNMDSHNCRRVVKNGRVENEGDVQAPVKPYPISYRSIVPKQSECENLLAPVCLAASHIAYGSIRMEPVFMILGQSAASAAGIALNQNIPVQKVDYAELKRSLLAGKQVLDWREPTPAAAR